MTALASYPGRGVAVFSLALMEQNALLLKRSQWDMTPCKGWHKTTPKLEHDTAVPSGIKVLIYSPEKNSLIHLLLCIYMSIVISIELIQATKEGLR